MLSMETSETTSKRQQTFPIVGWLLTLTVVVVAMLAWGNYHAWRLAHLSTYAIFPLFGITAFSVMWSQYVMAALAVWSRADSPALRQYFSYTGFAVVALILAHPGLLVWQLWRDGFGLPPESYLQHFVAPSLKWVALLGTTSLFIFLAYELRRLFGHYKWWRYIGYLTDAAMLAIFYHGLRLGDQLQHGWFRAVWFGYGTGLVMALLVLYAHRFRRWRELEP